MKFSHLHVHTQFSLLDGEASIKNLYKKAIADGMPALAISDHGNMFGVFEFVAEAYKNKDEKKRRYGIMKYVCDLCGWEYDEEKGYPEGGIAPGTKWEDVPEDFECPLCFVGKDQFSEE